MAILLQFIAMGLFILIGIQIYNAFREPRLGCEARGQLPASSAGSATSNETSTSSTGPTRSAISSAASDSPVT